MAAVPPYDSVRAQLYRESIRILHAQLVAFGIGRCTARLEVCRDGGFVELLADTNGEMIDEACRLTWADDQTTLPEFHECASVPLCNFRPEDAVVERGRFRHVGDVEGHMIDAIASEPRRGYGSGADRYQGQALDLREKAGTIAESAVRYEQLFGPQSDWVSGARKLSQYYATAAQDLERLAEAHAEVARTGQQQRR